MEERSIVYLSSMPLATYRTKPPTVHQKLKGESAILLREVSGVGVKTLDTTSAQIQ